MATKTTNYGLTKPDGADFYDVDVQNNNMDIVDEQMKANAKGIEQLNSDISGLQFDVIHLSGTTDGYGQIWVGAPNIKLDKVTYIECLTNTFSRSVAPYGIINLESIENEGLKFRLIATNNSTFNNYPIDKNVAVVYKY